MGKIILHITKTEKPPRKKFTDLTTTTTANKTPL